LAHLSQRHFARGIEAQKQVSTAAMAGLLAGILLAVGGSGDAGIAAIAGSQAGAMQTQLRYSRENEQEADRIGMKNLVNAGLSPLGPEQMFKIMQSTYRGSTPPEFLMTHPLTESRINDTRSRALNYPLRVYEENPDFSLVRVRVALSYIKDNDEAVAQFRKRLANGGPNAEASQYGLVLALTRQGSVDEAKKLLAPLRKFSPANMIYGIAEAEILVAAKEYKQALELLNRGMELVPGNYPITMAMANAYMAMNDYYKAAALLNKLSETRPRDPQVWYLLAESQGKAGNILGVHLARAEYFVLNGMLEKAQQQLGFALEMQTVDNITRIRITERIEQIKKMQKVLRGF
jgi:predicted Zn-dependent protease